jgi:hypothetical protein
MMTLRVQTSKKTLLSQLSLLKNNMALISARIKKRLNFKCHFQTLLVSYGGATELPVVHKLRFSWGQSLY